MEKKIENREAASLKRLALPIPKPHQCMFPASMQYELPADNPAFPSYQFFSYASGYSSVSSRWHTTISATPG